MHMISRKDFNPAECHPLPSKIKLEEKEFAVVSGASVDKLETVKCSRVVCQGIGYFLDCKKSSRKRQQRYRLESSARITDIHVLGPVVKKHISSIMVVWYSEIRKTSFQSRFHGYQRRLLRQARLAPGQQHHHRKKV